MKFKNRPDSSLLVAIKELTGKLYMMKLSEMIEMLYIFLGEWWLHFRYIYFNVCKLYSIKK